MVTFFKNRYWTKNPQAINAGEGVEKREPTPYTVSGSVNWYSHYGEQYGGSLKNEKLELPYDPEIPLLGIYLEKNMIWKDPRTPMSFAALFAIAKTEEWLLTEEWIKTWYLYTIEYYWATEKSENICS